MITRDQPTIFDQTAVRCVVSSAEDGNTRPEWSDDTVRNIEAIAKRIDASVDDVIAMDVNGHPDSWDEIVGVTVRGGKGVLRPEERVLADAVVTNVPGAVLLLPVADCNAVAIHDPVRKVVALVHLGWKSTVAGLATKVVQHLQQAYGSSATDLRVYISPAIKAESYIFDEVTQSQDPVWKPFLRQTDRGVGVDLPGYNRQLFIDAGVTADHIEVSPVDTATSTDYFSHYRSSRSGEPEARFALLIGLK